MSVSISLHRNLVKLNLSYNQIHEVTGFKDLRGDEYKLTQLELHGNRLASASHVTSSLAPCQNLRYLAIAEAGADNPLCHNASMSKKMQLCS